jgi:CBS domain-containing protein
MSQSHVSDILKTKGQNIWFVHPQDSVSKTLKLMAEKNVGAVLVCENEKIAGIFSERDFARHCAKGQINTEQALVKDMMTTHIFTATPQNSMDECMALMTAKHIRHLPVLENHKLVGLISIGDVVKRIIEDHKFSITQLERYVTGET